MNQETIEEKIAIAVGNAEQGREGWVAGFVVRKNFLGEYQVFRTTTFESKGEAETYLQLAIAIRKLERRGKK